MATPYSTQTISGYNSSPPSDDGSQTAANEITWAKHKTKLGDPIKTLSEAINTELLSAFGLLFGQDITAQTGNFSVTAADQGKFFTCTNSPTVSLLAAATAGAQFPLVIANDGTGTVTIDPNASETINGATTLALAPNEWAIITCNGANWRGVTGSSTVAGVSAGSFNIPKYIAGVEMSNGTDTAHDIDITTGAAMDSTDAALMILSSALTKQIDASWAEGTNAGGFPTGLTLSNSTWYHVFLIGKTDGTVDAGFDTSLTATNLLADASAYTYYRRIGSVLTDGTANIIAFSQTGDYFEWNAHVEDYSAADSSWTTSAATQTLTVPIGVKVLARVAIIQESASIWYAKLSSAETSDHTAGVNDYSHMQGTGGSELWLITNTSAQVYKDSGGTTAGITYTINTRGWRDFRGQE